MQELRVLDLFAGLQGWSKPFRERGHHVVTLDFEPKFRTDIVADILETSAADLIAAFGGQRPDVILASPPCEGFSVARIGSNWEAVNGVPVFPKTDTARLGLRIVEHTANLINELQPTYFIVENPRAALRKMRLLDAFERRTVSYCMLGETFMKPTDLWGGFPPSLKLPDICKTDRNAEPVEIDGRFFRVNMNTGKPCHEVARRGAKTGLQGLPDSASRAEIPSALATMVMEACERDFPGNVVPIRQEPEPPTTALRNIESW